MKLWLLRHARIVAAPGLCYGRTDLEADAGETRAAAERIAPLLPANSPVLSSPRTRCRVLANAIAAMRPDLSLRVDERLAEMDFGAWEGQVWSSIGREAIDAWMRDFADAPTGGDCGSLGAGETVREFMQRVGAAFDEWTARGRDALWVTHAGVQRAVQLLHAGVRCPENAAQWPLDAAETGNWLCIEVDSPSPRRN